MPDQFTESTTIGFGSRITKSLKNIVFGILLFLASFCVLYWNEGRYDLSLLAKTSVEIPSAVVSADAGLTNKLISTTGVVQSNKKIGDNLFLKPDVFLTLNRKVEMYAWKENQDSKTKSNLGGSQTQETTYTYVKEWTEWPSDSSRFKHPEGHENPMKSLDDASFSVDDATIGVYHFSPQLAKLPTPVSIQLTGQNVVLKDGVVLANDRYIFIPKSANSKFDAPNVGDLKVSYAVVYPGFTGTLFGSLNGGNINSYSDENGHALYRLFSESRNGAISSLHGEYTMMLWLFRALGFFMMWFGLMALFGTISVLLDVVPIFGSISRSVVGMVTFLVSAVLSVVTIVVSMILHSLVALVVSLVATCIVIVVFLKFFKKKGKNKV